MSAQQNVERDERTTAVANAGCKWAYSVVGFGLLIDVAYRGFVRHEAAWDLIALVVAGGVVSATYQARQKILGRWSWKAMLISGVVAAVVGFLTAVVLSIIKFK